MKLSKAFLFPKKICCHLSQIPQHRYCKLSIKKTTFMNFNEELSFSSSIPIGKTKTKSSPDSPLPLQCMVDGKRHSQTLTSLPSKTQTPTTQTRICVQSLPSLPGRSDNQHLLETKLCSSQKCKDGGHGTVQLLSPGLYLYREPL